MRRIPLDLHKMYGNWKIIEEISHPKGKRYICECQCEFKSRSTIVGTDLRKGKSSKCKKCAAKATSERECKNLRGKEFGKWQVIERVGTTKYRRPIWLCLCKCGRYGEIPASNLLSGLSKKCGHCNQFGKIGGRLWTQLLNSAKSRNIEVSISLKELEEIYNSQNGKCALSGVNITLPSISTDKYTASIDRIDNTIGYTKENCQWVHKAINRMKHVFDNDEFISMCHNVAEINSNPAINWVTKTYFKTYNKKDPRYKQGIKDEPN